MTDQGSHPQFNAPPSGRFPAGGPTPGAGFPLTPGGGLPTPGSGLPAPSRFEVLEELGRGGHGVVLRARDRVSGRELAVKVLMGRGHEVRERRFAREAELAGKLRHPGIVTLVDADVLASPPWLAFSLVPGAVSLAERWSSLQREARLEVLLQVARSVGYAHSQGVVHRDLKPDNVLVDPRGRAYLIDFGVATGAEVERLTLSGAWVGTPYYMSPEQLHGRTSVEVGPPADVWALGALLYEALTELRPFPGESVVELAEQVSTHTPRPLRKQDPSIDPRLEGVCAQALARDPAERFPDGGAFAEALELALRAPSPLDRRWLVATAGLGAVAVALTSAILLSVRGEGAPREAAPDPSASVAPSEPPSTVEPHTADPAPEENASPAPPLPTSGDELEQRAAAGDAEAMHQLARRLFKQRRLREANAWRERAAEAGHLKATQILAQDYLVGRRGLAQDYARAAKWLRRAGEAGDLTSLTNLGVLLAQGKGLAQDQVAAAECFRRAAEGGETAGQRMYANRLYEGQGVAQDEKAGVRFAKLAAAAGDAAAHELLGVAYYAGRGVAKDLQLAGEHFRIAGEGGRPQACGRWALLAQRGSLGSEARSRWIEFARRGVELGDGLSMRLLGTAHWEGKGLPRDAARAVELWERASKTGDVTATHCLGVACAQGEGTPKDEARARTLFREALGRGHVPALHTLAVMLRKGRGGPRDLTAAAALEKRAAEAGDPQGMEGYGRHLEGGIGIPRDLAAAMHWFRQAHTKGNTEGGRQLALLLLRENEEQAQREAVQLLKGLVQTGDAHACALLSAVYRGVVGKVRPDRKRAHDYAQRAVELDSRLGRVYLGDDYLLGKVVPKDVERAFALWRRAAEQGEGNAVRRIGQAYLRGTGVPVDLDKARTWLEKGVALDDVGSQQLLDELNAR